MLDTNLSDPVEDDLPQSVFTGYRRITPKVRMTTRCGVVYETAFIDDPRVNVWWIEGLYRDGDQMRHYVEGEVYNLRLARYLRDYFLQ